MAIVHLIVGQWFTGIFVSYYKMLIVCCSRDSDRTIDNIISDRNGTLMSLLDGFQTHFLTALFLVMCGSILYFLGLPLFQDFDIDLVNNANGLLYFLVMWVGSAISTLNIVSSSTLMH